MGTPSRLESGGPVTVWGFDSLTLRFPWDTRLAG